MPHLGEASLRSPRRVVLNAELRHVVFYDVDPVNPSGRAVEIYSIPVASLVDAKGLAFWIRQLADKTWITKDHLGDLASIVHELTTTI